MFFCFVAMMSLAFSYPASSEDNTIETTPERLKAHLIIKFADLIQWPENSSSMDPRSPFIIGIMDAPALASSLAEMTWSIKINEKKVKVITISDFSEIKNCHILFISELSSRKFYQALETIGNFPILTIGDSRDYEKKGIMINLFSTPDQQRLKFAVNCLAAKKTGISMTSKILKYAATVIK